MGRLLILALYEELIAGYGQRRHQNHKLLEVHFPVLVLIQVPHDLLHHQWIGTSLGQTHQQEHEEAQGKKQWNKKKAVQENIFSGREGKRVSALYEKILIASVNMNIVDFT